MELLQLIKLMKLKKYQIAWNMISREKFHKQLLISTVKKKIYLLLEKKHQICLLKLFKLEKLSNIF